MAVAVVSVFAEDPISDDFKLPAEYPYLGWVHFKDPSQNPKSNCDTKKLKGSEHWVGRTITFSPNGCGEIVQNFFVKNVKVVVLLLSEWWWAEQNWPNGRQRVKTGSCKVANSEENIFDVHKNGQSKCP